jgi:hypothetical protein
VRRLLRFLRFSAAFLSLAICLALAYLWHRSHRTLSFVSWNRSPERHVDAVLARGVIAVHHDVQTAVELPPGVRERITGCSFGGPERRLVAYDVSYADPELHFWTYDRELRPTLRRTTKSGYTVRVNRLEVTVPFWPLTLVSAIAPALWTVGRVRRCCARRRNHCVACGYDLRATPARCPECGALPRK